MIERATRRAAHAFVVDDVADELAQERLVLAKLDVKARPCADRLALRDHHIDAVRTRFRRRRCAARLRAATAVARRCAQASTVGQHRVVIVVVGLRAITMEGRRAQRRSEAHVAIVECTVWLVVDIATVRRADKNDRLAFDVSAAGVEASAGSQAPNRLNVLSSIS